MLRLRLLLRQQQQQQHHQMLRGGWVRAQSSSAAPPPPPPPPRVALVQGASRGLGLEFVRQLLARPGQRVVATCRSPSSASELAELRAAHGPERLTVTQLDCTDEASVARAAAEVGATHSHLDLLVNTAAILHAGADVQPETALARVRQDALMRVHLVNAFGPLLVTQAFAPLLVAAAHASGANPERPAVVANLSARVGSIGDNRLGGWYAYRASKASLNQLTKCASLDFERRRQHVACILLHPGTVDTDLSAPFQKVRRGVGARRLVRVCVRVHARAHAHHAPPPHPTPAPPHVRPERAA